MTLSDYIAIHEKMRMDWQRVCEEYKSKKSYISKPQLYVIQVRRQNLKHQMDYYKMKIETHHDYGKDKKANFFRD